MSIEITIETEVLSINSLNSMMIAPAAGVIGYRFFNTGNTDVLINNIKLSPGDDLDLCKPGLIDKTTYRLRFASFNSCGEVNAELTILTYKKA